LSSQPLSPKQIIAEKIAQANIPTTFQVPKTLTPPSTLNTQTAPSGPKPTPIIRNRGAHSNTSFQRSAQMTEDQPVTTQSTTVIPAPVVKTVPSVQEIRNMVGTLSF
jgi:hypothetical protein